MRISKYHTIHTSILDIVRNAIKPDIKGRGLMKMSEFNDKLQEASYDAWKDPIHSYSSFKDMPDPEVYAVIDGLPRKITEIYSSLGRVMIGIEE